jgi:hypothetical protein
MKVVPFPEQYEMGRVRSLLNNERIYHEEHEEKIEVGLGSSTLPPLNLPLEGGEVKSPPFQGKGKGDGFLSSNNFFVNFVCFVVKGFSARFVRSKAVQEITIMKRNWQGKVAK